MTHRMKWSGSLHISFYPELFFICTVEPSIIEIDFVLHSAFLDDIVETVYCMKVKNGS